MSCNLRMNKLFAAYFAVNSTLLRRMRTRKALLPGAKQFLGEIHLIWPPSGTAFPTLCGPVTVRVWISLVP